VNCRATYRKISVRLERQRSKNWRFAPALVSSCDTTLEDSSTLCIDFATCPHHSLLFIHKSTKRKLPCQFSIQVSIQSNQWNLGTSQEDDGERCLWSLRRYGVSYCSNYGGQRKTQRRRREKHRSKKHINCCSIKKHTDDGFLRRSSVESFPNQQ
jgi:hypothetical protein